MHVDSSHNQESKSISRTGIRFIKITIGSLIFMLVKLGCVAFLHYIVGLSPWLNYGVVTISVSILGWIYHSKISFGQPLTRQTLVRYAQQAIVLKILDYAIYNALVYAASVDLRIAVLFTSGLVFATRVLVYVKYVFVTTERPESHGTDSGEVLGKNRN